MRKLLVLISVIALLAVAAVPSFAQEEEPGTIVDVASGNEDFSTLVAAVLAADPSIAEALSNPEAELTVFAPTNDAFAALLESMEITAEDLLADTETLNAVLTYHVVEGAVPAGDVLAALEDSDALYPETLNGARVTVTTDGESVFVNDATVVATDVMASNGIIHVIDTVLMPPASIAGIVTEAASSEDMPEFTTLLAAVDAAGLVETLSDPEAEFTVFAPTDAAFAAALEALGLTAEDLLADTELLTSVLTYHVIEGEVYSGDLVAALADAEEFSAATVNGAEITFTATEDGVFANDATIIDVDIVAGNGVIHVIDSVLLPPAGE